MAGSIDGLPFALPALPLVLSRGRDESRARALGLALTVLHGVYQTCAVALFGRTVGQLAWGIRVVDQRTGALPTLRQSAIRWGIVALPDLLERALPVTGAAKEASAAMRELQPDIDQLRLQHRGDPRALNEALRQLYAERGVHPLVSCLPVVLRAHLVLLSQCLVYAPALRQPLGQGLHDRLAKTMVVQS